METNIVLYRKYRPQKFSEIIGQDHVVKTLMNSITSGSISHAYLFTGPRGSGKTSIARIFAKAINCEDLSNFEPCNKCASCQEIMAGNSMDLIEIDGASNARIDEVRELIDGIKFAPVKSKYKIFIIDECHQLSKPASNALLKTLEEPPAHAVFILATTEAHKMIPTIVSRCQRFDFKRLLVAEIIKKLEFILKKEGIKFENAALSLIALNARGSFRDAESLLDKCINFAGTAKKITVQEIKELLGIVEVSQISKFVDFIMAGRENSSQSENSRPRQNAKEAVLYINAMVDAGVDLQEFVKTLTFYLRQILLLKIQVNQAMIENAGFLPEEVATMKAQIGELTEKDIQRLLELFIDAENKMKYSTILQLPLELAIVSYLYDRSVN